MICINCKNKSECRYYLTNIAHASHMELGMFANDAYAYLFMQPKDLDTCIYDNFKPIESEE